MYENQLYSGASKKARRKNFVSKKKEIGMTDERKAYLTNNPSGIWSKKVIAK
jgi:hypothetical protein